MYDSFNQKEIQAEITSIVQLYIRNFVTPPTLWHVYARNNAISMRQKLMHFILHYCFFHLLDPRLRFWLTLRIIRKWAERKLHSPVAFFFSKKYSRVHSRWEGLVEPIRYKLEGCGFDSRRGCSIFFNLPSLSSVTIALGFTQPVREMSTRNLPGSKVRPAAD
jgi:hypothetical protein